MDHFSKNDCELPFVRATKFIDARYQDNDDGLLKIDDIPWKCSRHGDLFLAKMPDDIPTHVLEDPGG